MLRLLPTRTLLSAPRPGTLRPALNAATLAKRHDARFMSRTSRVPVRRQAAVEDLLRAKRKIEAISGELPSTPAGSPTGFGGFGGGGGGGSGVKEAILTTIFGVFVRKYLLPRTTELALEDGSVF